MAETILVTGSDGFIGRVLCARLDDQGFRVLRHDRSAGDIVTARLSYTGVRHVFHLAARTFVPEAWESPAAFYLTNVGGTANVADFCRVSGASLTLMSSYVYGRPRSSPIAEDHPVEASNPYAHTKILAEDVARYFAGQFRLDVTVVRPFNVYGPGQAARFLIPTLIAQAVDPRSAEISIADDRPRRDYVFVEDVADLLLRTRDLRGFRVYNAGSGHSSSPRELADLIGAATGVRKPVVSRGELRADEILDTVADTSRARRELGWTPRTSLEEGLRRTVDAARQARR